MKMNSVTVMAWLSLQHWTSCLSLSHVEVTEHSLKDCDPDISELFSLDVHTHCWVPVFRLDSEGKRCGMLVCSDVIFHNAVCWSQQPNSQYGTCRTLYVGCVWLSQATWRTWMQCQIWCQKQSAWEHWADRRITTGAGGGSTSLDHSDDISRCKERKCVKLCHTAMGNSRAIWDRTVLPATRQRWDSCLYPQLKQVLDLATLEGCKAELTYVTWKRTGWDW